MENYNDNKKNYCKKGNLIYEFYFLNYELHRTNGPAYISYYRNGNIKTEYYYLNDKRHRIDGPAITLYDENGNIKAEYYYLNGKFIEINSLKKFKKYTKTLILK